METVTQPPKTTLFMERPDKPVARVLYDANEYMLRWGWIQHEFGSPGKPVCPIKAIELVAPSLTLAARARKALAKEIGWSEHFLVNCVRFKKLEAVSPRKAVIFWNDNKRRTEYDVHYAFLVAAANISTQGG